jgi:hypothetical protein
MTPKVIGHPLFTDGTTRPVYQDERGQFIVEDGERVDGVWLAPEELPSKSDLSRFVHFKEARRKQTRARYRRRRKRPS